MISMRSSSVRPPQIPYGSCTERACARHAAITGHVAHTAFAARMRASRRGPRSPSGWKNISVGRERQAPSYCHSQTSATGFGSRVISLMPRNIQSFHRLFKYRTTHDSVTFLRGCSLRPAYFNWREWPERLRIGT